MNIAIITFHSANNYGAVLQTYALSKILKNRGHDVKLIDLPLHERSDKSLRSFIRSKLSSIAFRKFRKYYLPEIVEPNTEKDLYIFGSDQIWNLDITKSNFELYFGSFLKEKNSRIAYAASFGNSTWKYSDHTDEVKKMLDLFQRIGIRESSGVSICKEEFSIQCEKVLDPTMLLEDYDIFLKKKSPTSAMVCYIFGKDDFKINEILKIAYRKRMNPVLLNDMRLRRNIKSVPFPSVSKWLSYLKSSDLILTDSFHCMVFAILFKKNFIAIPAIPDRIDRMLSLLSDLGLESRFFNRIENVSDSPILFEDIDYIEVGKKLSVLKQHSLKYLKNSLDQCSK